MSSGNGRNGPSDKLFLTGWLRQGRPGLDVKVCELSPEGATLQGANYGSIGAYITLFLGDVGTVYGTISRIEPGYVGVTFFTRIDHRLLRRRIGTKFGIAKHISSLRLAIRPLH